MDALERLRAIIEQLVAERDEARQKVQKLEAVARVAIQQRDALRKDRDNCIKISVEAQNERDEARQEAWRWRNLYCFTSTELESEHPFPWEAVKND